MNLEKILDERGSQYGDFADVADVAQHLKKILSSNTELNDVQKEGLDMIASKLARIVVGNPNHRDSWIDIAGYAQLVADRIAE